MRKPYVGAITVVVAVLFFVLPVLAATDESLLGTWEHVDEEYAPAETTTIIFLSTGVLRLESLWGDTRRSETATWDADGKILRFVGVPFLGRKNEELAFTYTADGERLVLQPLDGNSKGGKVIFTRVPGRKYHE